MLIKPRTDSIDVLGEMKAGQKLDRRCIVYTKDNKRTYFVLSENIIEAFFIEETDAVRPGNIYTAIINKTNKVTGSFFVKLDEKNIAYLSENEIGENPIVCNMDTYRGRLCEGDQVLVQIKKAAYKEKKPLCTCKLKLSEAERERVIEKGIHTVKYQLIKGGEDYLDSLLKEKAIAKFVSADKESYDYVNEKLAINGIEPNKDLSILYNATDISLAALYGLRGKFDELMSEKVWIKNGSYLFINPTEAMTVIDVNSGKASGKDNLESNFLEVNLAAAAKAAEQIGARNISGIIIIDFINMKDIESRTILIEKLKEELGKLNPPGRFVDITKLGLVEITRQKIRPSVYDIKYKMDKTILM